MSRSLSALSGSRVGRRARFTLIACVLALVLVMPAQALAFKPAGHNALLTEVVQSLPPNDPFRKAYEYNAQTAKDAAWGAMGPDIGLGTITAPLEYVPWRDSWHTDRSGSFAAALLKSALESGDERRMAFALGYVTHVSGDLALQANLTRPDAGVVYDQPRTGKATRDKIDNLETAAEAFVWTDSQMGGNSSLSNLSASVFPLSFSQFGSEEDMRTVSTLHYGGKTPNVKEMMGFTYGVMGQQSLAADIQSSLASIIGESAAQSIADVMGQVFAALGLSDWYKNDPRVKLYAYTQSSLTESQKTRIRNSFLFAKSHAVALLQQAERDDYHGFTDAVTLDVGTTQTVPPAPAIIARVRTGSLGDYAGDTLVRRLDGPGTDDDVWIRFTMKDGSVVEKELGYGKSLGERNALRLGPVGDLAFALDALPMGIGQFNDMEGGRIDEYPLHIPGFAIENVASVGLRKATGSGALGDGTNGKWRPEYIELSVNGKWLPRITVSDWYGQPTTIKVPNPTPWDGRGLMVDLVVAGDSLQHDYPVAPLWTTAQMLSPKPAAPTSAQAAHEQGGGVRLTWNSPAPGQRIRVLRSVAGGSGARWASDVIAQKLVYEGRAASCVDTDVVPAKVYVYSVYAINDYEISSNRFAVTVQTREPLPGPVTNLVATRGSGAVSLSWTNPTDEYFDHAVVVRKLGSAPTSLTDGTQVARQSPVSALDQGLTNGLTYHYAVYPVNGDGAAGTPALASATPAAGLDDMVAPGPVIGPYLTMSENTATVTWTNPTDADFSMVRVLRSPFGFATSPNPAYTITDPYGIPPNQTAQNLLKAQWIAYQGPAEKFTDHGLLLSIDELDLSQYSATVRDYLVDNYSGIGVRYYYTVFARDAFGRWSVEATNQASTRDRTPPDTKCEGISNPFAAFSAFGWGRLGALFYPWVDHDVTLTLAATDAASGVRNIYYQLDGSDTTTYTAPLVVGGEGSHTLEFWSYDNAGNLDGRTQIIPKDLFNPFPVFITHGDVVKFGVDKTPPTASSDAAASYTGTATITLSSVDFPAPTDTAAIRYLLDSVPGVVSSGGTVVTSEPGAHELTFWAVDRVGHVGPAQTVQFSVGNATELSLNVESDRIPYGEFIHPHAVLSAAGGSLPATQAIVFEKREGAGPWTPLTTIATALDGGAGIGVPLTANTSLRARFAGSTHLLPVTSDEVAIEVMAGLSTPSLPSNASTSAVMECSATISPKKPAGTTPVTMDCYHWESGGWVLKTSVPATATDFGESSSLLTAQLSLPLGGTWRICAHYPGDATNAETYSDACDVDFRQHTAMTGSAPSTVLYGKTAKLTGTLKTAAGSGVSGHTVVLQSSADAKTWKNVRSATTGVGGAYAVYSSAITAKTYLRVIYPGDFDLGSSAAPICKVMCPASVGTPVAPSTMYKTRDYTIYGFLRPLHTAGTYPVYLYKYRYVGGSWKSYGYTKARAYNYTSGGSTYTKYSVKLRLPYAGKWRIQAYAPADSGHLKAYSPGYDTVTVR